MVNTFCFFIGHRDAPEDIYPLLLKEVIRHGSELGVTDFIVGGRGNFDRLASLAVREAKLRLPHIRLLLLLHYHPAEKPVDLSPGFDDTWYPEGMEKVPRRLAIVRANRMAADAADFMIAYAKKPGSNSLKLADYAAGRGKRVTLI